MYLKQRLKSQIISLTLISSVLLLSGCLYNAKQPATTTSKTDASSTLTNHPLKGKIISMTTGQPLSYTQLLEQLQSHRFILLGEKHDNPEHHLRELQLLEGLQTGPNTRLVLEMLDESQAESIAQLSENSSKTEIQTQLHWNHRSWPWQDYGPLIKAALKNHNQLTAGNLSKAEILQIYQGEPTDKPRLAPNKIPEAIRATIQQQIYESHCQAMPLTQMGPMTQIQISRDASMAYALSDNLGDRMQAILIAGSFHVRKDTGVPLHLQQWSTEAVASILLIETETNNNTIEAAIAPYAGMADYLWFTSKSTEKDYCASLQQQSHQQSEN